MVRAGSHPEGAGLSIALTLMLIGYATTPVDAAIWAAAFRAFLRPGEVRFAYLRLGTVELRLTVLVLLAVLAEAALIGFLTAGPIFLDPMGAFQMWYVKHQLSLLYWISGFGSLLGALALVRFMLTPAILVDQNRTSLSDSWRLTRSSFWSLTVLILAWLVLRMAVGQIVGLFIQTVSKIAAARGLNWLTLVHTHSATTAAFPTWMSIPRFVWMTSEALLDALSIVVIAGIATTAYLYVTVAQAPTSHERPA